jgi:hypothetical protein
MAFASCADCEVIHQAEKRGRDSAIVEFMSNHDWMYAQAVEDCIEAIEELSHKPGAHAEHYIKALMMLKDDASS